MPSRKSQPRGARTSSGSRSSTKSTASEGSSDGSGEAASTNAGAAGEGPSGLAEQLTNRVINPLGLVVLTRDRIQEILDDAAARGRVTRSDANELATELVNRGRQQTDQLMSDVERLVGRGRQQLGSATMRARRTESVDLLVRSADRARRTVGAGQSFPVLGYDDLTAAQVQSRLDGLSPAELRKLRHYEQLHANRKSVLAAIDKHLKSG